MGNYRFRLSDMIPNAWFYKLKDMNKSRKNQQKKKKKIIYHHHHGDSKEKANHTSSSSFSSSSSSFSSSLSSREREQNLQGRQFSHQRKSYYFSRDLGNTTTITTTTTPENEEVVKKIRSSGRNRGVVTSSVSADGGCSCRGTVESVWSKPEPDLIPTPDEYSSISPIDNTCNYSPEIFDDTMLSWSSSRTYCPENFQEKDIIIMDSIGKNQPLIAKEFQETSAGDKNHGFQFNLPPIITNHKKIESLEEPTKSCRNRSKFEEKNSPVSVSVKDEKKQKNKKVIGSARRYSANSSQGVKLRTNSPRIMNLRNIQGRKSLSSSSNTSNSISRKSISESFAVVKSSKDPKRDFRDSMVEMIMENNLSASKDLEDLLACYLSLNSDEYHDLIITVFKQIWFDIIDFHIPN